MANLQRRVLAAVVSAMPLCVAHQGMAQCFITELKPPLLEQDSFFGWLAAVSDDWIAVGDPGNAPGQNPRGYVLLFRRRGTEWVRAFTLHDPGAKEGGNFGVAPRLDGDRLLLKNQHASEGCVDGAVYLYRYVAGDWTLQQIIGPPDCGALGFAKATDMEGGRILVGAPGAEDAHGLHTGAVFVYSRPGGGNDEQFVQEAVLLDPGGADDDSLGGAVALSGDVALVGSVGDNGQTGLSGSASFFHRSADGTWSFAQKVSHSLPGDVNFGSSVAVRGDVAIVGAPFAPPQNRGRAFVYERSGDTWQQVAVLSATPQTPWTNFGTTVAISPSADALYVGDAGTGRVFVFERQAGAWVQTHTLTPPTPAFDYGAPSLGGELVVVGARDRAFVYAAKGATDCNRNGAPDACDIAEGTSGDADGDGVPDECEEGSAADIDASGAVDAADLGLLLGGWGPCGRDAACPSDLDGSGAVDGADLGLLLGAWGPGDSALFCPGVGDCCAPAGDPGCADERCCAGICAEDPYCCATTWDRLCADQARGACGCAVPAVCGASAGDCCDPWSDGTPGCADEACCGAMCIVDPYCCETGWDTLCSLFSKVVCGCTTPICGPGAGECCKVHDTPGCSDAACCQTVCNFEPFCCTTDWDAWCSIYADAFCGALCN